jgi:hypothetical protein
VAEVKTLVCGLACEKIPELTITPETVRLRERDKGNERLGKVLRDDITMAKATSLYDRRPFSIQLRDGDDTDYDSSVGDLIILFKVWNPATWELSTAKEIKINKNDTVEKFGTFVSEASGIPMEKLSMFKITYGMTFVRGDLTITTGWYKAEGNKSVMCGTPYYTSIDGQLFVVKDHDVPIREMTEEEKVLYTSKVTDSDQYYPAAYWDDNRAGGSSGGRKTGGDSRGVKIMVKKRG